jgi:hypothetical protein
VAEQESAFAVRDAQVGVTADQRREDYELLQIFDRMSLLFCTSDTLAPRASEFSGYRFKPAGHGAMSMSPFPFDGREQRFSLLRRWLPKKRWRDGREFRREFFATEPEPTAITIRADGAG